MRRRAAEVSSARPVQRLLEEAVGIRRDAYALENEGGLLNIWLVPS